MIHLHTSVTFFTLGSMYIELHRFYISFITTSVTFHNNCLLSMKSVHLIDADIQSHPWHVYHCWMRCVVSMWF